MCKVMIPVTLTECARESSAQVGVAATDREFAQAALAETACDSSLAVTLGHWSYAAQDSPVADTGSTSRSGVLFLTPVTP
jgi:hypothetical protein